MTDEVTKRIFKKHCLRKFMRAHIHNNWVGTEFKLYPLLSNKMKGVFGEKFVAAWMEEELGIAPTAPDNPGHDRIFQSPGGRPYKTEIKFGLANSPTQKIKKYKGLRLIVPDTFVFNHIALGKDWDRFIFFGVNPVPAQEDRYLITESHRAPTPIRYRAYFMTKAAFRRFMTKNPHQNIFGKQQGGEGASNDDYMVAGLQRFYSLIDLPFVKEIKGNW